MKIKDDQKVTVDYYEYQEPIKSQRPIVYLEGKAYCCISDSGNANEPFGAGRTLDQALNNWADAWRNRHGQ